MKEKAIPAFQLFWDSASGSVQVRLPSGTRLNISRETPSFLWNFLDALTQVHTQDPKYLLTPMTEKQFRAIFARWKSNGNKALQAVLDAMEPATRQRLTDEQIETLRQQKLAEGYVVIRGKVSPPKDLSLDDLIAEPLNLDGLI